MSMQDYLVYIYNRILAIPHKQIILYIFLFIILLILALKLAKRIAERLGEASLRRSFIKRYHLSRLSDRFQVLKASCPSGHSNAANHYVLRFPTWMYATQSGARDHRYQDNRILWEICELFVGQYHVLCYDPVEMVMLVNTLRAKGCEIRLNRLEVEKYNFLLSQHFSRKQMASINAIIASFSDRPTDFEEFCAEVFRAMGFHTQLTARTNDGGYDIYMTKDNLSYIVECKCYSISNPIGRPLMQKLVGANAALHADVMAFVTTSTFSTPAIEYGNCFHIWMIDGTALFRLYETYLYSQQPSPSLNFQDWSLTKEDLLRFYPMDYDS